MTYSNSKIGDQSTNIKWYVNHIFLQVFVSRNLLRFLRIWKWKYNIIMFLIIFKKYFDIIGL